MPVEMVLRGGGGGAAVQLRVSLGFIPVSLGLVPVSLRRAAARRPPVTSAQFRRVSGLLCFPGFPSTVEWRGAVLSLNKACSGRRRWRYDFLSLADHGGRKRRGPPRLRLRPRVRDADASMWGVRLLLLLLLAGQGGEGGRGRSSCAGGSDGWLRFWGFAAGVSVLGILKAALLLTAGRTQQLPIIVRGVNGQGIVDAVQMILLVDAIWLKAGMNCLVYHFPDDSPKLDMSSICGYVVLALHQFYLQIYQYGSDCIGQAAQSTSLQRYYVCAHQSSISGSPIGLFEQANLICYCCRRSLLIDDKQVEDTVPLLFGLCHRRWTTTPSSLILRFNRGDPLILSSVKAIQYLQLIDHIPQVHTPDRPLGESTAGHQLVWSTNEAFGDRKCSKFEPELSSDKRPLFDSTYSLRYLLSISWSSRICCLQLTTAGSCSLLSFVILYFGY